MDYLLSESDPYKNLNTIRIKVIQLGIPKFVKVDIK
jgi:hypothetical protein